LDQDQYRIKINGNPVATTPLPVDLLAVLATAQSRHAVRGRLLRHPAYKQPLLEITPDELSVAQSAGLTFVDASAVLLHHLEQVVKRHAAELLSRDATRHLVEETRRLTPAVVEELMPDLMKLADVQRILQRLLVEGVSIRQLSTILEVLGDEASRTSSELELTELVRRRLARTICAQYRDARDRLSVVTLDPALEERVRAAQQRTDREVTLRWSSTEVESFCRAIDRGLESLRQQGRPEVLLVRPEIRIAVRHLTAASLPELVILSYSEVTAETKVVSLGIVSETEE
jgi:flagellar biosynthesis protein FlhA